MSLSDGNLPWRVSACVRGGSGVNQDFADWRVALAPLRLSVAVVDGATGLDGEDDGFANYETWSQWFASSLVAGLLEQAVRGANMADLLARACARIRTTVEYSAFQAANVSTPTAAFALARLVPGGKVEFSVIGDCVAVVKMRDGEVVEVRDSRLARFDELALRRLYRIAADLGVPPREAIPRIWDDLRMHRSLANSPDGYWAADPSGIASQHVVSKNLESAKVGQILLASDGFEVAVGRGKLFGDWDAVFEYLRVEDVRHAVRGVTDFIDADPEMRTVRRFSLRDDATLAYVELAGSR